MVSVMCGICVNSRTAVGLWLVNKLLVQIKCQMSKKHKSKKISKKIVIDATD